MMRIPIVLTQPATFEEVSVDGPCPTCKQEGFEVRREAAKGLGREAARTIFQAAYTSWYDGLLEELATQDPYYFKRALARCNKADSKDAAD